MFSLLSMIWEYKASYLSGFLFFFVAMVRRPASPPSLCDHDRTAATRRR